MKKIDRVEVYPTDDGVLLRVSTGNNGGKYAQMILDADTAFRLGKGLIRAASVIDETIDIVKH